MLQQVDPSHSSEKKHDPPRRERPSWIGTLKALRPPSDHCHFPSNMSVQGLVRQMLLGEAAAMLDSMPLEADPDEAPGAVTNVLTCALTLGAIHDLTRCVPRVVGTASNVIRQTDELLAGYARDSRPLQRWIDFARDERPDSLASLVHGVPASGHDFKHLAGDLFGFVLQVEMLLRTPFEGRNAVLQILIEWWLYIRVRWFDIATNNFANMKLLPASGRHNILGDLDSVRAGGDPGTYQVLSQIALLDSKAVAMFSDRTEMMPVLVPVAAMLTDTNRRVSALEHTLQVELPNGDMVACADPLLNAFEELVLKQCPATSTQDICSGDPGPAGGSIDADSGDHTSDPVITYTSVDQARHRLTLLLLLKVHLRLFGSHRKCETKIVRILRATIGAMIQQSPDISVDGLTDLQRNMKDVLTLHPVRNASTAMRWHNILYRSSSALPACNEPNLVPYTEEIRHLLHAYTVMRLVMHADVEAIPMEAWERYFVFVCCAKGITTVPRADMRMHVATAPVAVTLVLGAMTRAIEVELAPLLRDHVAGMGDEGFDVLRHAAAEAELVGYYNAETSAYPAGNVHHHLNGGVFAADRQEHVDRLAARSDGPGHLPWVPSGTDRFRRIIQYNTTVHMWMFRVKDVLRCVYNKWQTHTIFTQIDIDMDGLSSMDGGNCQPLPPQEPFCLPDLSLETDPAVGAGPVWLSSSR